MVVLIVLGAAATSFADRGTPIARGRHISGAVHFQPRPGGAVSPAGASTCSTPGSGNYLTNCHGQGRPVNETWLATRDGSLYVAGANDYNSYDGQGPDGCYWSSAGTSGN